MKIFMVFTEKEKYSFYFIVYMPMLACDVITNDTKQNMDVIAPHSVHWRDKMKEFRQVKIILLPKCFLHSN